MNTIQCPKCQREDQQIKVGFNASGSQRYKSKVCGCKHTPQPTEQGYPPSVRQQAVRLYVDGMNFRRIARHYNIIAYQDKACGDGDIFADYHCSPGVAVDRYREGHRFQILISLRETKYRNDVDEFHIERTIKNGFT